MRKATPPRGASWTSCARADGWAWYATSTIAPGCRCRSLAGQPNPSTIPAMIARRVGARIWMSRCLRVGKQSRFQIELKEFKVPRSANQGDDVKWITSAMQSQFEAWIREAPEQWMWSNRRWS